jgi:hypothetical protein
MSLALLATSHSPLLACADLDPAVADELDEAFNTARSFVKDFDPDLVINLGPDHYNGFFYRLMPPWMTRPLSTFVDIVRVLFLGYCVWLTIALMMKIGGSRMAIIDWPIGILYGFVCFGFVLMTWRAIGVAWDNWKRGYSVLERPELADEMK